MTMPATTLDLGDAAELSELLQFLSGWLAADQDQLNGSLTRFVGNPGYDIDQLRVDLDRFTFLLGGDDGETHIELPTEHHRRLVAVLVDGPRRGAPRRPPAH